MMLSRNGTLASDTAPSIATRVKSLDWPSLTDALDQRGCAVSRGLLSTPECAALADGYDVDELFRSRVVMERHDVSRLHGGRRHSLGIIFHDAI